MLAETHQQETGLLQSLSGHEGSLFIIRLMESPLGSSLKKIKQAQTFFNFLGNNRRRNLA